MYGNESWVDNGHLMHDLEVADVNVGTNRRDKSENCVKNYETGEMLDVEPVEGAARRNRLR